VFILTFEPGAVAIKPWKPGQPLKGDRLVATIPELGELLWDLEIAEDMINDAVERLESSEQSITLPVKTH